MHDTICSPCQVLFSGLTPDEMNLIQRALRVTHISRGAFVFRAGEQALMIYLVYEGVIKKTYSNARGDEQVLGIFQPGDMFGHLFLGKYPKRIATAIAVTDAIIAGLVKSDLERLIRDIPQLGLNLIQQFSDEQREIWARLHAMRQANAHYRLLGTLLTLARRVPGSGDGWAHLPTGITQADIASLAGLNRTTASLLINDLRREAVLGGSGRVLTVHRARVEHLLEEAGLEILE
ncbi:MAG: Crp/Fnr family transcriptional regulator [Chloroflexota bacterium]|nr:Crp/Fnr family transcriptional regulator [Chloroflexota bacterium]